MQGIDETLSDRERTYGAFRQLAKLSQDLKSVMRNSESWEELSDDKKESLDMIVHKIARILNGDPNYKDSWHDIGGYARLVEIDLSI